MDDIGSRHGCVYRKTRQTNICPIKNAFFLDEEVGKEEEVLFEQTGTHQHHHQQHQQHRDDRTNTIIMTRWVYTVRNSAATIFSYSTISSLRRIIFVFIICVFFFFLGCCSHPFASESACHCVNSIKPTSRCNYCDINDEGNFRVYVFWNCHT